MIQSRLLSAGRLMVCACGLMTSGGLLYAEDSTRCGTMEIINPQGEVLGVCPLRHTSVHADVAGFIARVSVKQIFHNTSQEKIEAIYSFPLPHEAAVDSMVMTVGDRRITGQIRKRDEARAIYEAAKSKGHVTSLLDQERPNIFTQSVANIEPGAEVTIEISYVETIPYKEGVFEWVFPMVVGPRYIPGGGSASAPMTKGHPTDQVPDGDKITPPVTPKGTRAGHDISIEVNVDAGMDIGTLESMLHEIDIHRHAAHLATVRLRHEKEIPNKDFILRYQLAGDGIEDAFLSHQDERGKYFTLILQPPQRVTRDEAVPRELIFVLDTSGSMRGYPIDKAKETMKRLIDTMGSRDTFNLITFAGHTRILWDEPKPATRENIALAQGFLHEQHGGGGTEMMTAINAALQTSPHRPIITSESIRIVCFMTDGYVGNDMAIIDAVKKNAGTTRVFSFGIGNSVNRFLLDGMAHEGRGEVEYVTLVAQADEAVERFYRRIESPVLTDIEIDWGELPVTEVYPKRIPDLFDSEPILIHGRIDKAAHGTITLNGLTSEGRFEDSIVLDTANSRPHEALASLWARAKIKNLMHQDLSALQQGRIPDDLEHQITRLGLDYRLVTQFTSFVAVEELRVTVDGELKTIEVPIEMPDGVSHEGIFGEAQQKSAYSTFGGAAGTGLAGAPRIRLAQPSTTMERTLSPGDTRQDRSVAGDERVLDSAARHTSQAKLSKELRGLASKVLAEGRNGNLSAGTIRVVDFQIDVVVILRDLSKQTLEAIRAAGLDIKAERKSPTVVVGRIDVRKLEALSELSSVVSVKALAGE